jgi:hypothetical protein
MFKIGQLEVQLAPPTPLPPSGFMADAHRGPPVARVTDEEGWEVKEPRKRKAPSSPPRLPPPPGPHPFQGILPASASIAFSATTL